MRINVQAATAKMQAATAKTTCRRQCPWPTRPCLTVHLQASGPASEHLLLHRLYVPEPMHSQCTCITCLPSFGGSKANRSRTADRDYFSACIVCRASYDIHGRHSTSSQVCMCHLSRPFNGCRKRNYSRIVSITTTLSCSELVAIFRVSFDGQQADFAIWPCWAGQQGARG